MSLTASRVEEDLPVPSPLSPCPGDPSDPSHTLPSFTFVMYQLSLLLSSLGSTANDTYARQQLLAALSNVLYASLQLRQINHTSYPSSPAVQAAPAHPATSPITEPSHPSPERPPPPSPTPHRRSSPTLVLAPASPIPPLNTIRVLTPVEPLTAPLYPRHSRRSRKRRVRSCPSSPVPNKRPSSEAQPSTVLTTAVAAPTITITSSNPFAPLAADEVEVVEQVGSEDTIAHITPTISATVSPATEPASPPSPVDADVVQVPPAAVTQPVADPTPTPTPTPAPPDPSHRFFQVVCTRSPELRTHFHKHYVRSKTVCACDLFPVYSSMQHCDAKLPPEFDNLCLLCVYMLCNSLGAPALNALYHWLPAVDTDICTVYAPFYSDSEIRDISAALPKKVGKGHEAHTARCGRQLLARLGATAVAV